MSFSFRIRGFQHSGAWAVPEQPFEKSHAGRNFQQTKVSGQDTLWYTAKKLVGKGHSASVAKGIMGEIKKFQHLKVNLSDEVNEWIRKLVGPPLTLTSPKPVVEVQTPQVLAAITYCRSWFC